MMRNIIHKIIPPRYGKLAALDKVYNGNTPADVLVLGDSVMERVAREDADTRCLGKMICDQLGINTHVFSGTGYHPGLFLHVLHAIGVMKHYPEVIVLPINLRCFSPQWKCHPAWQYTSEIEALCKYLESDGKKIARTRPSRIDLESYNRISVSYPLFTDFKTIGDFTRLIATKPSTEPEMSDRKAAIFTFHYLHELQEGDNRLELLAGAVSFAQGLGVKVLLYTTPINITPGNAFMNTADRIVHDNMKVLKARLEPFIDGKKTVFCNWRGAFEPGLFFSRDHATEHLNETGRAELAGMISDKVKDILGAW